MDGSRQALRTDVRATDQTRPSTEPVPTWLQYAASWAWRTLVIVASLALLLWGLARLYLVVLPVIAALVLATFLVPPSRWLMRRGFSRTIATAIAYVGGLLLLLLVLGFVVERFVAQSNELLGSTQQARRQAVTWLQEGPLGLSSQQINSVIDRAVDQVRENQGKLIGGILGGAALIVELVGAVLLTAVILFFFVRDGDRFSNWLLGHAPREARETLAALGTRAWQTLGGYVRAIAVIGFLDAIPTGIALLALGVPLVIPLMVLIFLGAFLPIVGAFISGFAAVVVAFASRGGTAALIVLGVIVVVQQVEGHVLQPWIMGRSLPLHPVVVLLVLTAGGVLGGVAGAALAVPTAGVLSAVGNQWRLRNAASDL